ncbi:hypothetical protein [Rochambeau virus]|uniref:Uncharacterized protein n=1 Tax=Rochambeau virus TaxID=380435 RepID=A0A0D3R1H8_9RHAB|nr:hypothetical protein [Rochambeau virus]AJR28508.1 hypothetical protein [Rochambeau virus]
MVPSKTLGERILTELLESHALLEEEEFEAERVYICRGNPDQIGALYARACVWLVNLEAINLLSSNWDLDHEEPGKLVVTIFA